MSASLGAYKLPSVIPSLLVEEFIEVLATPVVAVPATPSPYTVIESPSLTATTWWNLLSAVKIGEVVTWSPVPPLR